MYENYLLLTDVVFSGEYDWTTSLTQAEDDRPHEIHIHRTLQSESKQRYFTNIHLHRFRWEVDTRSACCKICCTWWSNSCPDVTGYHHQLPLYVSSGVNLV